MRHTSTRKRRQAKLLAGVIALAATTLGMTAPAYATTYWPPGQVLYTDASGNTFLSDNGQLIPLPECGHSGSLSANGVVACLGGTPALIRLFNSSGQLLNTITPPALPANAVQSNQIVTGYGPLISPNGQMLVIKVYIANKIAGGPSANMLTYIVNANGLNGHYVASTLSPPASAETDPTGNGGYPAGQFLFTPKAWSSDSRYILGWGEYTLGYPVQVSAPGAGPGAMTMYTEATTQVGLYAVNATTGAAHMLETGQQAFANNHLSQHAFYALPYNGGLSKQFYNPITVDGAMFNAFPSANLNRTITFGSWFTAYTGTTMYWLNSFQNSTPVHMHIYDVATHQELGSYGLLTTGIYGWNSGGAVGGGQETPSQVGVYGATPPNATQVVSAPVGQYAFSPQGNVYNQGGAPWLGSTAAAHLNLSSPVVAMSVLPSGNGYYLVTAKGNIYNFGAAKWYGSTAGINLPAGITDVALCPSGGYYIVTAKGNVYNFGGAPWLGSTASQTLPSSVRHITVNANGGYTLVEGNGQTISFS